MGFSGARLSAARVAAGLSQSQFGDLLGVDQSRVSSWERGVAVPRPEQIPRMAQLVGLDALDFLDVDQEALSLADLRLAAGLSREELAKAGGLDVAKYRRLELGATRRDVDEDIILKLAHLLAVPAGMVEHAIEVARGYRGSSGSVDIN